MSETEHRFIEESFPVREVGLAGAREKNIRQGNLSTMHIWWARRPLGTSRATAYAALTPKPADPLEWQKRRNFIIELARWESSLNPNVLDKARSDILGEAGEQHPRVIDPFSGGGSYPLEAQRLGCAAYANDYNPVAVLLLKAALEYPARFAQPVKAATAVGLFGEEVVVDTVVNPLLAEVKRWGAWVLKEANKELSDFYPAEGSDVVPVGYLWARTIPCQNPACGAEVPLLRQLWLANKDKKKVAMYPYVSGGELYFRVVGDGYDVWPEGFDPNEGTVRGAVAICPVCGAGVDDKTTRRLFLEEKAGQRMIAVVTYSPARQGKAFRPATAEDERTYQETPALLEQERGRLADEWGLDPVPDEPISSKRPSPNARGTSAVTRYGLTTWGSIYNQRQQLALITFVDKIRETYELMLGEGMAEDRAGAITTYLALALDMVAVSCNTLCRWESTRELVADVYSRQALPMLWDYIEVNPFSGTSGSWDKVLSYIGDVLKHCSAALNKGTPCPVVTNSSATRLPYGDNYFDAILTDPPYYDNVPYSHISDFFYVWLKRSVGHIHTDLFSTPLTPKAGEIVAYTLDEGGFDAGKRFFEDNLKLAFQEMHRVLKPNGISVIVYAHKSTEGWETLINALLDSGLIVTGAWPLNTEMQSRVNATDTASLASSIYVTARKMERHGTGFYNEVRDELRTHMNAKLQRLWEEGIGGADFFIAAIGSAIEVFGKYEQVLDYEGNVVRADRLLDEVNTIATDYAVRQILHNGFAAEISDLARFYVLWRWNYGEARVPFDEARKLAQSVGIDLPREWARSGSFVRKEKEYVLVLGPQQRKLDDLEDSRELIDVLHKVLLLWEKGQRAEMVQALSLSGFGRSEAFYRVAQAVSETLPNESREKKLLDGFLTGRERLRDELSKGTDQQSSFLDTN